jgi:hypothetical protein
VFTASPIVPVPLEQLGGAPAVTVNGYTGPATVNLSTGREVISVEENAERIVDGSCLYCVGFNHTAAEWAERQKAQTFQTAGGYVHEGRIWAGSKKSEKD